MGEEDTGLAMQRAVARYVFKSRQRTLTQDEEDCLRLYSGSSRVHGGMEPDCQVLESTPAYTRGRELHDALYGPVIPFHQNPHAQRSNVASLYFERLHGREPAAGNMLRQSDWEMYQFLDLMSVAEFIDAWQRQLQDIFCPLKIEEGGRVYRFERVFRSNLPLVHPGRQNPLPNWAEWREDEEYTAEWWWEWLCYALNVERFQMENIHGVMFLGVVDGEHRCRPATSEECRGGTKESA